MLADRHSSWSHALQNEDGGGVVRYTTNDSDKIHLFQREVEAFGHVLLAIGIAGLTTNKKKFLQFLDSGGSLKHLLQYENWFGLKTVKEISFVCLTADGKTLHGSVDTDSGNFNVICHGTGVPVIIGGTREYFKEIRELLPDDYRMTPLDYHILGNRRSNTVSEEYDYYVRDSGHVVGGNTFRDDYAEKVCARVSKWLAIDPTPIRKSYMQLDK
jgi:hypothetical protein